MKITGYQVSQGEYQGNQFFNYYIHVSLTGSDYFGTCTKFFKVKKKVFDNFIVNCLAGDPSAVIGSDVSFLFDVYRNVVEIRLISNE